MRKTGIIALLSCVFALCLALVGCGGSGAGSGVDAAKAAFTGTWDLVEMNQDGEITSSEDLETLKSLGLEVFVNLNEDGTAQFDLFGEVLEGSWEAASATEGTLTLEGQKVDMKIADSRLTFEQEGASLTFEKGEPKEATSSSDEEEADVDEDEAVVDEEVEDESTADESTATDESSAEEESAEGEEVSSSSSAS